MMERTRGPRQIQPPVENKPALQTNVFHALRGANTALMPIFPYGAAGELVPAASIMWGGPNRDMSAFNHTNSVDEVAICFASEKSRLRSGFVHVGARTHLVGNFFEDMSDPDILMVIVVTQRQAEEGIPQGETLGFLCDNCQNPLLVHEFSAKTEESAQAAKTPGFHPPLETLTEGAIVLEPFNESEVARTCSKCGTVSEPFPVSVWGWDAYYKNMVAAERGRKQLLARAAEAAN
ncbi:hypothetical protein SAMN05518849_12526 [Sphingobium sp. AP50]|uniref:hypothetical protein n=1 Tax=Sphingobium sp. AP50 TaxID=1884369 RepID=UPI0008D128AF|nr:hypothetical protein [Sphingobium sp. AP50]SEK00319.1 hypothetical protein SAMN05518849_12526 [Sphingobium sp. AP50]